MTNNTEDVSNINATKSTKENDRVVFKKDLKTPEKKNSENKSNFFSPIFKASVFPNFVETPIAQFQTKYPERKYELSRPNLDVVNCYKSPITKDFNNIHSRKRSNISEPIAESNKRQKSEFAPSRTDYLNYENYPHINHSIKEDFSLSNIQDYEIPIFGSGNESSTNLVEMSSVKHTNCDIDDDVDDSNKIRGEGFNCQLPEIIAGLSPIRSSSDSEEDSSGSPRYIWQEGFNANKNSSSDNSQWEIPPFLANISPIKSDIPNSDTYRQTEWVTVDFDADDSVNDEFPHFKFNTSYAGGELVTVEFTDDSEFTNNMQKNEEYHNQESSQNSHQKVSGISDPFFY